MNRIKNQNRTFHLLQKADILTCYGQRILRTAKSRNRLHGRNETNCNLAGTRPVQLNQNDTLPGS
jgi:hypothetical protein